MKTSLTLLSLALIAPATILVGVAAPIALSTSVLLAAGAISWLDYSPIYPSRRAISTSAQRSERLPLAA